MKVLLADNRVHQGVNGFNMWGETALVSLIPILFLFFCISLHNHLYLTQREILAATRGDNIAAAILLAMGGADPALKDKWGKTAEEVAQDHGEQSTVQLFKTYSPGQSLSM